MKTKPIQDFILKNERNLRIAAAVGDAWPETRGQVITDFFGRLDARLQKKLHGWESQNEGQEVFAAPYRGYYCWKAKWKDQYGLALQCPDHGESMVFGVYREKYNIGKRRLCQELFDAIKQIHPAAQQNSWWEARIAMRSPASEWRRPDVLWRVHTDSDFLKEVADQLMEVALIAEPILDRFLRKVS